MTCLREVENIRNRRRDNYNFTKGFKLWGQCFTPSLQGTAALTHSPSQRLFQRLHQGKSRVRSKTGVNSSKPPAGTPRPREKRHQLSLVIATLGSPILWTHSCPSWSAMALLIPSGFLALGTELCCFSVQHLQPQQLH